MFNYYFVVAPVMLVMAYIIGRKSVTREKEAGRVVKIRYASALTEQVTATIMAAIVVAMITIESGQGIIQAIDDTIASDDPTGVYALVFAAMALVAILVVLAVVYWLAIRFAEGQKIERFKKSAEAHGYGWRVSHRR